MPPSLQRPTGFVLSLFAAVAVQKNVRDIAQLKGHAEAPQDA